MDEHTVYDFNPEVSDSSRAQFTRFRLILMLALLALLLGGAVFGG